MVALFERSTAQYEYFRALATIPFREYPEHGRREIEALIVPKVKVSAWFAARGKSVPAFLADTHLNHLNDLSADEKGSATAECIGRLQGRPRKASWPRVVQLVHQLSNDHPDWQKKRLAFEAHKRAQREFAKAELPSMATIQRSMVTILGRRIG